MWTQPNSPHSSPTATGSSTLSTNKSQSGIRDRELPLARCRQGRARVVASDYRQTRHDRAVTLVCKQLPIGGVIRWSGPQSVHKETSSRRRKNISCFFFFFLIFQTESKNCLFFNCTIRIRIQFWFEFPWIFYLRKFLMA